MVDRISKDTFDPYEPKSETDRLKEEIITLKKEKKILEDKVNELENKIMESRMKSEVDFMLSARLCEREPKELPSFEKKFFVKFDREGEYKPSSEFEKPNQNPPFSFDFPQDCEKSRGGFAF